MTEQELRDLMIAIESPAFQELVMKPIIKELDSLKAAYDCDTVKEMARLKGKREGLRIVIDRLKIAKESYQMSAHENDIASR